MTTSIRLDPQTTTQSYAFPDQIKDNTTEDSYMTKLDSYTPKQIAANPINNPIINNNSNKMI